jgi:hypothetical protein
MASFELPELPETRFSPQLLVGVASPLWGYFGAAAVGGVAYWWMTRWTQPVNLEAFFGAKAAPALEAAVEPVVETVEAVTDTAEQVVEAAAETVSEALPEAPVGGEAAPISPVVEATAPEPVVEAPPEPSFEATADPLPEPVAKPRVRKPPTANGLEA